jgi:ferrous iron transport protein B
VNHPSDTSSPKTVALVGNPNCGKTTLFNALTGSSYKVANYPGVTVEKKEGSLQLRDGTNVRLLDLPGTYALEGSSIDERIVTSVLQGSLPGEPCPDLIVAVVDATNLERNLFLVSELIDEGFKIVLAVNMMDAAEHAGLKIYDELLARALDLTVVTISARTKRGIDTLVEAVGSELARNTLSSRRRAWLATQKRSSGAEAEPQALSLDNLKAANADQLAEIGSLRYRWLRNIVERSTGRSAEVRSNTASAKLDALLTSRIWGLPILLLVFGLIFQAIFLWAQAPMDIISGGVDSLSAWLSGALPPGMLSSLVAEGIVPGVGNVVVFVPQIAILFLCIGLLEDSGYLSRAAFLLDNIMRRFGLQGRAFIPLLSSFACAIPGILSTRTIPSRSDRLATIMIAPLMSCSARLPVYAVLIGAFVAPTLVWGVVSLQGLVLLAMYALGVMAACAVAWVLKKTLLRKDPSFFVMEMPPLRRPLLKVVLRGVMDSVVSFLKNASTVILACSVIVWFLASYPKPTEGFEGNPVQASYAGQLGTAIEPAIRPLGFNWEIGIGILSSFPAREVFVTTLSTIYNISDDSGDNEGLIKNLQERRDHGTFSTVTAISLMVFYVFACMCMSTLAVARRETGSWVWTVGMFVYMTALAYIASLITFQVGSRLL